MAAPLPRRQRELFPAEWASRRSSYVVTEQPRSAYLDEGIRLFKEGEYFLSHETLEEHWIEAEPEERDFYQALIHLAVGFHHLARNKIKGASIQFRKALERLEGYPDQHQGVDLAGIRKFLREVPNRLARGEPLSPPELDAPR